MTLNKTRKKTLNVLACQLHVPPIILVQERDAHLVSAGDKVRSRLTSCPDPVDLVVLPELSSLDYSRATFERLRDLSEPLDGASFATWSTIAREHQVHVVYSFARVDGDRFYISVAALDPDGCLLGHYDKIHLAQYGASMEKEYFTRGDRLFVFKLKNFNVAPIICYDIRIPELSRTLVLDRSVDVILHCGAYFRDESFHTWHSFAITRAIENQVFLLSLNRSGANYGKSLFCDPWMDQKTPPLEFKDTEEDFRVITLDKVDLENARANYSFLKDRLPDYQSK